MKKITAAFSAISRYFRLDIYVRVFPYIKKHKLAAAFVVLFSIVGSSLGLLEPWPMAILIDSGLRGKPLPSWVTTVFPFMAGQTGATVVVFAVLLGIGLTMFGMGLGILSDYIKNVVNSSIILRFRADLFRHMQRLGFRYHDQTTVGDSMYRLDTDTQFIAVMVWGNFRHLLTAVLTLAGILWISFRLDWQLALFALASAPIIYLSIGLSSVRFKNRIKRQKQMESAANTIVQEVLSCLRVVKAFGTEEREQERFEKQSWTALRASWQLMLLQSLFGAGNSLVRTINRSAILLVGALHVLAGKITIGELLVIQAYVSQIHGPLSDLGDTFFDMQVSLASAERTTEVMDVEPDVVDRPGAVTLDRVQGAIGFEDVTFAYQPGHPVVHGVTFAASPGEVVAIVGPTGAGKTTISNLIARFYDPDSGCVTLDGYNLGELTVQTLRNNIALVIQEPILFTGSIRDNIAYARPDALMDEVISAAKDANAHDFISKLPDNYDTHVGQRGVRLSGGERQRIAIARAFLKDSPVLILDEPTSSVDSRTELVILEALDRLMAGRTTFIIAHRLSTVRRADQILVVEAGRIVERGTHAQLMRHDGLYAEFFRIQAAGLRRELEERDVAIVDWIAGGRRDVTRDQIVAAAMGANADAFIKDLPNGYDTMVGETGVKLSAEQREQLDLARSLLSEVEEEPVRTFKAVR
jgi:ABC-type multidrug transport system fused ATPase/permease subunit